VIGSTRSLAVWAYPEPVDLRNGYDGLSAIVVGTLKKNVLSGDCFLGSSGFSVGKERRAFDRSL